MPLKSPPEGRGAAEKPLLSLALPCVNSGAVARFTPAKDDLDGACSRRFKFDHFGKLCQSLLTTGNLLTLVNAQSTRVVSLVSAGTHSELESRTESFHRHV